MNVILTRRASAELDQILDYLRDAAPAFAARLPERLIGLIDLLADFPDMGRPGRLPGSRELVVSGSPYVVVYEVDRAADEVRILRVLHGARLWPEDS